MLVLAAAASPADLMAARTQMAVSLGWHIIIACFGVGFPLPVLFAEWRGVRTGDKVWGLLARRWARAMGVLFAVGAVSGTILSSELGILWPGLMGTYGEVIGLPFAIEGIWFFTEAIFLGIYLYAWDRLPPRAHMLAAVPIGIAGIAPGVLGRRGQRLDEPATGLRPGQRAGHQRRPVGGHVQPGHLASGHPHDPGRLPGHRVRGGERLCRGAPSGPA
jgi:hypothetical protein